MGRIPDEIIAEIRDRTDIVAVLSEHMALKKAGASYKGLCPFHGEKTPSFNVSPAKRSYYCFGCQRSGDVFKFVSELQGMSFVEVVHQLAGRAGVVIPERPTTPAEARARDEKSRLLDVNAAAATYYREQLGEALAGVKGRDYLERRGIGAAIAEVFRLGLAPDAWDGLARFLESRRITVDMALTLGLVAPRNSGGYYDKFRDRLMCPVMLPAGEVVGFSGRTLGTDPETPKYVNSSESPVYKKSHLLFGLHAARPAFRQKQRAVLVEGNFDVIALHQAGFGEVVAPLGTALTAEQVDQLRRLAPRVVLCLDGDKAGRAAALKAVPLCLAAGIEAHVAALPDGEDPDSFVRKQGAEALGALLAGAQPALDYVLDQVWYRTGRTPDAKAEAVRQVAPLVASVTDDVKRLFIIDQFAKAFDVPQAVILRALREPSAALPRPPAPTAAPVRPAARTAPPPMAELKLLAILADHPDLVREAEALGVGSILTDDRLRSMYLAVLAGSSFMDAAPADIGSIVAQEIFAERYKSVEDPRRTLANAVANLRDEHRKQDAASLMEQSKDAERRGDQSLARELLMRQVQARSKK